MPRAASRNAMVDALKFCAIATVPVDHLLTLRPEFLGVLTWLPPAVAAFNMPLFAFLAGYVLLGREGATVPGFIGGKAKALLVPYVVWISLAMPQRGIPSEERLGRLAEALINPWQGFQMWFLHVLFVMFAVFALARLVSRSDWWLAAVGAAWAIAGAFALPQLLGLDKVALLYPFLTMGYLVAKHRSRLRPLDGRLAAAGVAAVPVLLMVGGGGAAMHLAAGVAGILVVWAVYRALPERLVRLQARAGKHTLGIYGAQMILLPVLVIGAGVGGFLVSFVAVTAASLGVAVVLGNWSVTRALFTGRRPKRSSPSGASGSPYASRAYGRTSPERRECRHADPPAVG